MTQGSKALRSEGRKYLKTCGLYRKYRWGNSDRLFGCDQAYSSCDLKKNSMYAWRLKFGSSVKKNKNKAVTKRPIMTLHRDGSFAICIALLITLVRILYVRELILTVILVDQLAANSDRSPNNELNDRHKRSQRSTCVGSTSQ